MSLAWLACTVRSMHINAGKQAHDAVYDIIPLEKEGRTEGKWLGKVYAYIAYFYWF